MSATRLKTVTSIAKLELTLHFHAVYGNAKQRSINPNSLAKITLIVTFISRSYLYYTDAACWPEFPSRYFA